MTTSSIAAEHSDVSEYRWLILLGLINLARQLGGSFGIAILSTYVQDQTQFHRVNLVSFVTLYNPDVATRISQLAAHFVASGFSPARRRAPPRSIRSCRARPR